MNDLMVRVVSLKDDIERRASVSKILDLLRFDWKFLDAVDGRGGNISIPKGCELSGPEIACSLSHQNVYSEFLMSDSRFLLVFEDDISFDPDEARNAIFELLSVIQNDKRSSLVVILGGQQGIKSSIYFVAKRVATFGKYILKSSFYADKFLFRTCAYLIDRDAAEILIKVNGDAKLAADNWSEFRKGSGSKLGLYVLEPGFVIHPIDLRSSHIQGYRLSDQGLSGIFKYIRIGLRVVRFLVLKVLVVLSK
jgi:glycosyl transferase family 25